MDDNSKIIYKITYPNGKIYIGKDLTNSINYWGSVNNKFIAQDFSEEERMDMTIRREIILVSDDAKEINKMESVLIRQYKSNNPEIDYNQWSVFKKKKLENNVKTDATLSTCRKYRFALWRTWDESKPYVMSIGLNPSTADETEDDPMIRRCIKYAESWGYLHDKFIRLPCHRTKRHEGR